MEGGCKAGKVGMSALSIQWEGWPSSGPVGLGLTYSGGCMVCALACGAGFLGGSALQYLKRVNTVTHPLLAVILESANDRVFQMRILWCLEDTWFWNSSTTKKEQNLQDVAEMDARRRTLLWSSPSAVSLLCPRMYCVFSPQSAWHGKSTGLSYEVTQVLV